MQTLRTSRVMKARMGLRSMVPPRGGIMPRNRFRYLRRTAISCAPRRPAQLITSRIEVPTGWLPKRLIISQAKRETKTGASGAVRCACNAHGSVTVDSGPTSCAGGLGNHVSTSRQISAALYRLLRSAATGSMSMSGHHVGHLVVVVLHPAAPGSWCTSAANAW
jgi:hypothetical protein